jgi:hypothetical protein
MQSVVGYRPVVAFRVKVRKLERTIGESMASVSRMQGRYLRVWNLAAVAAITIVGCYLRGPDPTVELVESPVGPFEVETVLVPSTVDGFGGGEIYYPVDEDYSFGGIAVVPGFGIDRSRLEWYGPRLASHGFVVFLIETNSVWDVPDQRGEQLIAALDYMTTQSAVVDVVDPKRLAVMGYSFGGGGVIHATRLKPDLKAAIPLAMWFWDNDQSASTVPHLLISCEIDFENDAHTGAVYESLPASTPRAMMEIAGADHQCITQDGSTEQQKTAIARMMISFLKRHVDGDGRYEQFICPEEGTAIASRFECDQAVP